MSAAHFAVALVGILAWPVALIVICLVIRRELNKF